MALPDPCVMTADAQQAGTTSWPIPAKATELPKEGTPQVSAPATLPALAIQRFNPELHIVKRGKEWLGSDWQDWHGALAMTATSAYPRVHHIKMYLYRSCLRTSAKG